MNCVADERVNMHHTAVLYSLALWITGIGALLPLHTKSIQDVKDAEKRDAVARDAVGTMGFVTFKMSKSKSSVRTHSLHGLWLTLY